MFLASMTQVLNRTMKSGSSLMPIMLILKRNYLLVFLKLKVKVQKKTRVIKIVTGYIFISKILRYN